MARGLCHGRHGPRSVTMLSPAESESFIRRNTTLTAPPHVPEMRLHLADEAHDLWHRTEDELAEIGLPPPFWAFAWAGGQGLARYVIDHPDRVRGRSVLDIASGSGIVAIAAAMSGAAGVLAADIEPFCRAAVRMNAAANAMALDFTEEDQVGTDSGWDVVLAGDVFYHRALAARLEPWLRALAARGALVLVGDPGRSYLPKSGLEQLAVYEVAVTRALEDSEVKRTTVWRLT